MVTFMSPRLMQLSKDFILSGLFLFLTHSSYLLVRSIAVQLHKKYWPRVVLSEYRLFSISILAYVLGMPIVSGFLPVSSVARDLIQHVIYCVNVVLILNCGKVLIFMAMESRFFQLIPPPSVRQSFLPLLQNLINLLVIAAGLILILQHFHYDIFSLVTALGVSSLAVGFAAKDSLSHLIAGFILILDRNLRQGDLIQLDPLVGPGVIMRIGLRSTQIHLSNGNLAVVPNSDLLNTKVQVLSQPSWEGRASFQLKLNPQCSVDVIHSHVQAVFQGLSGVVVLKGVNTHLLSFAEGFLHIEVSYWVQDVRQMKSINSEFQSQLLSYFVKHEIRLLDLYVKFERF